MQVERRILCATAATRRQVAEAVRPFRHLSPSIALKRNFLAVDLTVSWARPLGKSLSVKCLSVPETSE